MWRSPRVRLASLPHLRIGRLIVVAGASGAGKSSLLRELAAGRLPGDIAALLPNGVEAWPQTGGTHVQKRFVAETARGASIEGLVLHYDLMRPFESLLLDYEQDPSLAMIGVADATFVLTLRPSDEVLRRQIEAKAVQRSSLRTVERRVRRLFRSIVRPSHRFIYPPANAPRHARLAELYRSSDFIGEWYARWDAFLAARLASGAVTAAVTIDPARGLNEPTSGQLHRARS